MRIAALLAFTLSLSAGAYGGEMECVEAARINSPFAR